jgi:WD40 repeat protein
MSLGTVADLVDYFNLNRHIFEKERSNKEHM